MHPSTPYFPRECSLPCAWITGCCLWATLAVAALGQAAALDSSLETLSAEQIAVRVQQRNDARAAALRSYESRRTMTLAYKGKLADKQASEIVEMTYTAPSSKQFVILAAQGSPLLRDSVFQRAMSSEQEATARGDATISPANYTMKLLGTERLPEGPCYVLEVTPRRSSPYLFQGKVWVQGADFAVVRVDAQPMEEPSFWVRHGEFRTDYSKVGDFWFPARMTSTSHVRMGGDATLTIQYGPYHILSAKPLEVRNAPPPPSITPAMQALAR